MHRDRDGVNNRNRFQDGNRHNGGFVVDLDGMVSYAPMVTGRSVDRRSMVNVHTMVVAARVVHVNAMAMAQLRRFGHRRGHHDQKDRNLEGNGREVVEKVESGCRKVTVGYDFGFWALMTENE